jgi:hypothetical protein
MTENKKLRLRSRAMRLFAQLIETPEGAPPGEGKADKRRVAHLRDFKRLDVDFFFSDGLQEYWIFTDAAPDVLWPIDVGFITENDDHISAWRFVSEDPKRLRSLARIFSPHMASFYIARVDNSRITARQIVAYIGGAWKDVRSGQKWCWLNAAKEHFIPMGAITDDADEAKTTQVSCCVAITAALKRRYEWGIELSTSPTLPSLMFTTDPTGIKQLFDDREKGNSDRRDALVNWVCDHWRELRSDTEMETYVRKHIRGARTFEWRGFNCCVHPPLLDVERNASLRAERELMRYGGEDRRVRVFQRTNLARAATQTKEHS